MSEGNLKHPETVIDIPRPLEAGGAARILTFALPGEILTLVSIGTFFVVLVFLQRTMALRVLFELAAWFVVPLAAVTTVLSYWLMRRCGRRPGAEWPRLWPVALCAINAAILVAAVLTTLPQTSSWISGWRSLVHAAAIAGACAAAALLPRNLVLRPDSAWVVLISPLTLFVLLATALPVSCQVGIQATDSKRRDVLLMVDRLYATADTLDQVSGFPWRELAGRQEEAQELVARLQEANLTGIGLGELPWAEARVLDLETELSKSANRLIESVASGLKPGRIPRVSDLPEPAIRWKQELERWEHVKRFGPLSAIVGVYAERFGRLHIELAPSRGRSGAPVGVLKQYETSREQSIEHLKILRGAFTDHWAVFRMPPSVLAALDGDRQPTIRDLLFASMTPAGDEPLRLADLDALLGMPQFEARRRLAAAPGCYDLDYSERRRDGSRRFVTHEYYRIDCHAYTPALVGVGAEPRIELRLVYKSWADKRLSFQALPAEVYVSFFPKGESLDELSEEVMTQLYDATAEISGTTPRLLGGRGGSPQNGFDLTVEARTIRVHPPRQQAFIVDKRAIYVRAVLE